MNTVELEVDGSRAMTFEEKRKLSLALGNLTGDQLARAMDVVAQGWQRANPGHQVPEEGDIEVDIDSLSRDTLWALQRLIKGLAGPAKKTAGGTSKHVAANHHQQHHHHNHHQQQMQAGPSYGQAPQLAPAPHAAAAPAGHHPPTQADYSMPASYAMPQTAPHDPRTAGPGANGASAPGAAPVSAPPTGGADDEDESGSGSDSEDSEGGKPTALGGAPITQVSGTLRNMQPTIVKNVPSRKEPTVNAQQWQGLAQGQGGDPFASFVPREGQ